MSLQERLKALGKAAGEKPRAAADLFAYLEQQTPIAPLLFKNGSVLTQWGRVSGLDPIRGNVFCHLENWTVS